VRTRTAPPTKDVAMKVTSPILMAIAALSLALAACNTTAGAGRDMSSAGKAIERTAEDAKN
jgi:predicted small secreted protein